MDLLAPMTWSQGISGNSAVTVGGSEGARHWSGIGADIYQKYRFDLKYIGYLRRLLDVPDGGNACRRRHGRAQRRHASLSDRGCVSLTFKTTF